MLHDLLKENEEFNSIDESSTDFDIRIQCMEYNALKLAIPSPWKMALKT